MRYTEFNLLGVYVAPIAPMMVAAWVLMLAVRRLADHFGLLRYVWHPALFAFTVYLVLLSALVLLAGRIAG
jgi:protein AaeX